MDERDVYILLTRTKTVFSNVIHLVSGIEYTHAAIGIEGVRGPFYGFGRKYPELPFPGAFRQECPEKFQHAVPCRIYRLRVSDKGYEHIKEILSAMYEDRERYHYNFVGVLACRFDIDVPRMRTHHFFCSQFVAWLLQEGGVKLPVKPKFFRPSYFCTLSGVELIYEGDPPIVGGLIA